MITPVSLEIPAKLYITLKSEAGDARGQVAEIWGDYDFFEVWPVY